MFYLSKRAGLFQAPPDMVKLIWEWVLPRYAALVYQTTKDIKLKEAAGQDCDFSPDDYADYQTTIPLSLEGWKYDSEEFQEGLEKWKEMWSDIKVLLYVTEEPEYVGQYTDSNATIDIVLDTQWLNPSAQHYERLKLSIYRNIEHEVIHLGQYIFKHLKNLDFGGMPSKTISDPTFSPEGQHKETWGPKDYYLRDIEFYAILNDARRELLRQLQQWPKDMHNNIFKLYVGVTPSHQKLKSAPKQFLDILRINEPEKWQKAVKELYKVVKEASMHISKRAAEEEKKYTVSFRPTESQLEYFAKQYGIFWHSLRDRPSFVDMQFDEKRRYKKAIEAAFEYAIKELLPEFKKLNCTIHRVSLGDMVDEQEREVEDIIPATVEITADDYAATVLSRHPIVRDIEPLQPDLDINEVYV